MIGSGAAPAGIIQRVSETVECLGSIVRLVYRITARSEAATRSLPQGIGDLVAFIPEIKHVSDAVSCNPWTIIDRLERGNERSG